MSYTAFALVFMMGAITGYIWGHCNGVSSEVQRRHKDAEEWQRRDRDDCL